MTEGTSCKESILISNSGKIITKQSGNMSREKNK